MAKILVILSGTCPTLPNKDKAWSRSLVNQIPPPPPPPLNMLLRCPPPLLRFILSFTFSKQGKRTVKIDYGGISCVMRNRKILQRPGALVSISGLFPTLSTLFPKSNSSNPYNNPPQTGDLTSITNCNYHFGLSLALPRSVSVPNA
jgi:hypothetical protein